MKMIVWIYFLFSILLLNGCNSDESKPDQARIEPGKGIDGVYFGDSKEIVISKLGQADDGGIADGIYWNWIVSDYTNGSHAGLRIYFLEDPINTAGPVDILSIRAPYPGKTKEGIGIGSTVNEVTSTYGEPIAIYNNYSTDEGTYTYVYCINNKRLQIAFKENTIEGMGLGYYKIPPNSECDK